MPQGRRKVPFSGKAKKAQLQSKKMQKKPLEVAGEKGQFGYVVMCPDVVADSLQNDIKTNVYGTSQHLIGLLLFCFGTPSVCTQYL